MNFDDDGLKTLKAAIKLNDNNTVALNELAILHQVFSHLYIFCVRNKQQQSIIADILEARRDRGSHQFVSKYS